MNCARHWPLCAAKWKVWSNKRARLPELSDRAGSALEEVDRLSKIVDALFAISRLDAGEAQQEWERFDLAPLAASTTEQMSLLAEDKGISVACNAEGNVSVEGDRARIKQVVVNLLDNAIKYTPPGGSINLNVRARDGKAVLEVVDTGIGIPAEARCRIFSSAFFGWTRRARATRAGPGWGWPLSNLFAPRMAARWKWKAPKGRAAGSRWNCPWRNRRGKRKCMTDENSKPEGLLPFRRSRVFGRPPAVGALVGCSATILVIVIICIFCAATASGRSGMPDTDRADGGGGQGGPGRPLQRSDHSRRNSVRTWRRN